MLALAAVDGSFLGMPLDPIFVYYVYTDRSRFLLYVLLGAAGSAIGSIVLYFIGYTGGAGLLRKALTPLSNRSATYPLFRSRNRHAYRKPICAPLRLDSRRLRSSGGGMVDSETDQARPNFGRLWRGGATVSTLTPNSRRGALWL